MQRRIKMKVQAHRGVSSEAPENTLPAIELAIAQGYQVIEVDPDVTKDHRIVLLHDHHLGRTARTPEGGQVKDGLRIEEITYEEALGYDYGLWFGEEFKGTKIPLIEEILPVVKNAGLKLKIDNKYEHFAPEDRRRLYEILAPYQDMAELTCFNLSSIVEALEYLPELCFHYDGPVSEESLSELATILPSDRVTVWIPIQNKLTTWVKIRFADKEMADWIKQRSKLGVWILSSYEDYDFAESLGADIVETNGLIKPKK
jgi:glycerophosphoryl diester phosphodiesterase